MFWLIILLIVIYTVIIFYIFTKYNMETRLKSTYETYSDKLEIEATEAAYLLNKHTSTINLILADILTLVNKGYIHMEKQGEDYLFIKKEKTDFSEVKNHEMLSYKMFFNEDVEDQITIRQFTKSFVVSKEKYKQLELTNLSMRNAIELELFKKGVIDLEARKKLVKYNKRAIFLIIISIIAAFLSYIYMFKEVSTVAFVTLVFSAVLYSITDKDEEKLTLYGADLKEKVKGFKNYLKEHVLIEDKPLYMVDVLEYNYTMAVALGLANKAEDEFVEKEYNKVSVKKIADKCVMVFLIIIHFIYLLSLIDKTILIAIGVFIVLIGLLFVLATEETER